MLRVTVECKTLAQRKLVQPRFRLRGKIRKAIAETLGLQDKGRVQIDSTNLKIDVKKIICDLTISVHHFSENVVEIKATNEKGYSRQVLKLVDGVKNGTLAEVKFIFFLFNMFVLIVDITLIIVSNRNFGTISKFRYSSNCINSKCIYTSS